MIWFFVAYAAFICGHIIPGLLRRQIVSRIGGRAYIVGFSIVSLGLFGWLIHEVIHAQSPQIWGFSPWHASVAVIFMLFACIVGASAILQPCPLSMGRSRGFQPDRPGINALTRHPLLLAIFFWAIGHLVANGDLASILFFGGSAIFALIGMPRMEKIRLRDMNDAQRRDLLDGTRRFSPRSVLSGAIGWRDIVLGVVIYVLLLGGHAHVIGVDPLAAAGW
ncbi:NnrU family protein [Thalassospira sp. MA62]|nr:NnrU family protein [Thalassospira sp. MA62]